MDQEPQEIRKIAHDLRNTFVWHETPQEHDYWMGVYQALQDLADAREAAQEEDTKTVEPLGITTANDIQALAEEIQNSFLWHTTAQGFEYWSEVHDNLREVAEHLKEN